MSSLLENKLVTLRRAIDAALDEIRMYQVDPDHLGSITTIGIIEEILKAAPKHGPQPK